MAVYIDSSSIERLRLRAPPVQVILKQDALTRDLLRASNRAMALACSRGFGRGVPDIMITTSCIAFVKCLRVKGCSGCQRDCGGDLGDIHERLEASCSEMPIIYPLCSLTPLVV